MLSVEFMRGKFWIIYKDIPVFAFKDCNVAENEILGNPEFYISLGENYGIDS